MPDKLIESWKGSLREIEQKIIPQSRQQRENIFPIVIMLIGAIVIMIIGATVVSSIETNYSNAPLLGALSTTLWVFITSMIIVLLIYIIMAIIRMPSIRQ